MPPFVPREQARRSWEAAQVNELLATLDKLEGYRADDALREKAVSIGADAVLEVRYSSGMGLTTWGYMDAEGKAVRLMQLWIEKDYPSLRK